MADVLKIYLSECARRHLEPHYAFFANLEHGAIDVDIDFIPLDTLRVFLHALQASSSDLPASLAGFSTSSKQANQSNNNNKKSSSAPLTSLKDPTTTSRTSALGVSQLRLGARGSQGMYLSMFSVKFGVNKQRHIVGSATAVRNNNKKGGGDRTESYRSLIQRKALPPQQQGAGSGVSLMTTGDEQYVTMRPVVVALLSGAASLLMNVRTTLTVFRLTGFVFPSASSGTNGSSSSNSTTLSADEERLCSALRTTISLKVLDLSDSPLSNLFLVKLVQSVAPLNALQEFRCAGCRLSDGSSSSSSAATATAAAAATTTTTASSVPRALRALVLANLEKSQNAMFTTSLRSGLHRTSSTSSSPAAAAASSFGLRILDLSRNSLGDATLRALSSAFAQDEALQTFLFQHNIPTEDGIGEFLLGSTWRQLQRRRTNQRQTNDNDEDGSVFGDEGDEAEKNAVAASDGSGALASASLTFLDLSGPGARGGGSGGAAGGVVLSSSESLSAALRAAEMIGFHIARANGVLCLTRSTAVSKGRAQQGSLESPQSPPHETAPPVLGSRTGDQNSVPRARRSSSSCVSPLQAGHNLSPSSRSGGGPSSTPQQQLQHPLSTPAPRPLLPAPSTIPFQPLPPPHTATTSVSYHYYMSQPPGMMMFPPPPGYPPQSLFGQQTCPHCNQPARVEDPSAAAAAAVAATKSVENDDATQQPHHGEEEEEDDPVEMGELLQLAENVLTQRSASLDKEGGENDDEEVEEEGEERSGEEHHEEDESDDGRQQAKRRSASRRTPAWSKQAILEAVEPMISQMMQAHSMDVLRHQELFATEQAIRETLWQDKLNFTEASIAQLKESIGSAEEQKRTMLITLQTLVAEKVSDAMQNFYEEQQRYLLEAQKSWLVEPEDAIANDVVKLIQAGMDRIKDTVLSSDTAAAAVTTKGTTAAAPSAAKPNNTSVPPATAPLFLGSLSSKTNATQQQQQQQQATFNVPSEKKSLTSHETFLSEVNDRLSALGW